MSDITLMEAAIALDEARSDLAEAKAQVSRLEYYKLHHEVLEPAIDQMGGWANFKHWITRHSVSYFKTCEVLQTKLTRAESTIMEIKKYAMMYDSGERQYRMDDWDYINSRLDKYLREK